MTEKTCVDCGVLFVHGRGRPSLKCPTCRPKSRYKIRGVACSECGKQTSDISAHILRSHKRPVPPVARAGTALEGFTCPVCNNEFSRYRWKNGNSPTYCSKACANTGRSIKWAERRAPAVCGVCGTGFIPKLARQKYCSPACGHLCRSLPSTPCERCGSPVKQKRAQAARQGPARYCSRDCLYPNRAGIAKDFSTRAAFYGVEYDPTVKRNAVMVHDNWICGLCGLAIPDVPYSKYEYNPDYGTVDHILPMSRGGAHVWSNVQAAHHRCNTTKGNRCLTSIRESPLR